MKVFNPCYNVNCRWFSQWTIDFDGSVDMQGSHEICLTCIFFQRDDQYNPVRP